MSKLPKLAIERLKRAPQTTGTPAEPVGFPGSSHPDANLLSAFAEKSLTERERTEVLNHLAHCAVCREVMALALHAAPEVIRASPVEAKRRWTAWPTLRWVAVAAALGAVAIVVALHPALETKQAMPSPEAHPTIVANANHPEAPPAAEPPAPEMIPVAGLPKSETGARDAGKLRRQAQAMPGGASGRGAGLPSARREQAETQQQVMTLATIRPPEPLVAKNVRTESAEPKATQSAGGVAGSVNPAAPPPASLQAQTMPALEDKAQIDMAKEASPEHAASAQKMSTTDTSPKDADTNRAGGVTASGASPQAAPLRFQAEGAAVSQMSSRQVRASKKVPAGGEWSISPSGKVQRFDDGRKSWEDVRVTDGVTFRAITATGREIWAGGSAGALHHSSDGGVTWNRIVIAAGGNPVTETIVGIQSSSPLHIIVTLASGQQWVTEDGGQRWRSKP